MLSDCLIELSCPCVVS
ncbi:TPA: DUF3709 domain-containing protein [Vibrio cholerae]